MATKKTLREAVEEGLLLLLDTNVLLNAYKAPSTSDPYASTVLALLRQVPSDIRFTSELVKWEFLHGKHVNREEMARRRKWLKLNIIKVRPKHPAGYLRTLDVLTARPDARGGPVDGALAAYCVASKRSSLGEFAIATADGDDFCWHKEIIVVTDFFRGPACD